jgi:hypothetical protein
MNETNAAQASTGSALYNENRSPPDVLKETHPNV